MKNHNINQEIQLIPFCNIYISLGHYQNNFKTYLDEYPEQEELRTNWFKDNKYFLYKNIFSQNSMMFGYNLSEFVEACKKLTKLGTEIISKTDTYFITRWIRRN